MKTLKFRVLGMTLSILGSKLYNSTLSFYSHILKNPYIHYINSKLQLHGLLQPIDDQMYAF